MESLLERARTVRQLYARWEKSRYGRAWTREEIALGFVGDVGDLMKLVQAHAGVRDMPDASERLAHELSDCLWSVLVLADAYGIDIQQAFFETMDQLEERLSEKQ